MRATANPKELVIELLKAIIRYARVERAKVLFIFEECFTFRR